ncbi:DUF1963 domain-containing protein [Streptomyces sp. NPDC001455]|uniref:DUF1963 domain-containing protein n=1 Tax=unclassified Streptomyces TaxID=2593676 RepID=UPI00331D8440
MEANLRTRIHELGRKRGIPEAVVEEVLRHVRPSINLCEYDGSSWREGIPPAAMAGGLPRLPEGMEWPDDDQPHLVTIDCAALPRDVLDIDLPQDGLLLVFCNLDHHDAPVLLYVPAGTETTEREPEIVDEDHPVHARTPLYPVVVWHLDYGNWGSIPGVLEFTEHNPPGEHKMKEFIEDLERLFGDSSHGRIRLGGDSLYFQIPPEDDGLTHFLTVFADPFDSVLNFAFGGTREDIAARRYEKLRHYCEPI